jgi:RNA polymerase-binding transcription factor DksA
MTGPNEFDALKRHAEELHKHLNRVLFLMNKDDDGDYFICAEAEEELEEARQLEAIGPYPVATT